MRRQSGVALILVLMVTGVLALLMLQLGLTAREHTARAQQLVSRAGADLRLHSAKARLLFTMVTEPLEANAGTEGDGRPAEWNFSGRFFQLADAKVAVQDLNGLVPMPQPGDPLADFSSMLRDIGVPPERREAATEQFAVALSPPDSSPLQDFGELSRISGLTAAEIARLHDIATLYPTRVFNPLTATEGALRVRYVDTALESLLTLREQGALDAEAILSITGQGSDGLLAFFSGPGYRVAIRVSLGSVVAAEELTVRVDPYAPEPFELWSQSRSRPLIGTAVEESPR